MARRIKALAVVRDWTGDGPGGNLGGATGRGPGRAMIKVLVFLSRLPHIDREAFKAYYETKHAPMCEQLLPMVDLYQRNYPDPGKVVPAEGRTLDETIGFDALTILKFNTPEAYDAHQAALRDPRTRQIILDDEANFLDRSKTRVFVVDERTSPPAGKQ
jgi:hypothetical protein